MKYEIKRNNAVVLSLDLEGRQIRRAMGEDLLDVSFKSKNALELKKGDTIEAFGLTYKLNRPEEPTRRNGMYEYVAQFEAPWYDLIDVQFRGLGVNSELTEAEFSIKAKAYDIVDLVVRNANRVQGGWTIGIVDETDFYNFTFSGQNCKQVLNELTEVFGSELWFDNKTIHFQKRETVTNVSLSVGKGNGLYELRRGNRSDASVVTRLYVEGGSRNLPIGYGRTRLQLPDGKIYLEKSGADKIIEATQIFDNIIPERVGTVTSVGDMFTFSDSSMDFDVNDNLMDIPAKIGFQTGSLAGYEFELNSYNATSKTFKILLNDNEKAYPEGLPNESLKPGVGDEYVIFDIELPQSYVDDASERLESAGQAYLDKYSEDLYEYYASLTPIYVRDENPAIDLGYRIHIADEALNIDKHIRIAGYSRDLQNIYSYELELADELSVAEIVRQYAQQEKILYAIQTAGLLDPEQMRKNLFLNKLSENDGYLIIGNRKIKAGHADTSDHAIEANHALEADQAIHAFEADHALQADNSTLWNGLPQPDYLTQPVRPSDSPKFTGLSSPSFVSGWTGTGYRLAKSGDRYVLEVDDLFVRGEASFYSLIVNELRSTNGALIVSDGVEITGATKSGANYVCEFDTDTGTKGNPFRVDDVIKCQVWDGQGAKLFVGRVLSVTSSSFTISILEGSSTPLEGDHIVRIDNFTDTARKGIVYITASDSGAPYIDTVYGMWTDPENSVRTRMGNLSGIISPVFGQLTDFGFYGKNAFLENSHFSGNVYITGGNASTKEYAEGQAINAKQEAISAAASDATTKANNARTSAVSAAASDATTKANTAEQSAKAYALNQAESKAAIAQSNAVQQASLDATTKAEAAKQHADDMVSALDIGGRNLLLDSDYDNEVTGRSRAFVMARQLVEGEELVISFKVSVVNGIPLNNNAMVKLYSQVDGASEVATVQVKISEKGVSSLVFTVNSNWTNVRSLRIFSGGSTANSDEVTTRITKPKLEEGNKPTSWTPAVEDVNNAIEAARQLAIDADYARQQLASSLKSLAYEDVVEVAKLGDTVMQGGMLRNTLIDTVWLKANIINAEEIVVSGGGATTVQLNQAKQEAINTAASDAASKANAAKQHADDMVNALKIGGKNLILRTGSEYYLTTGSGATHTRVHNDLGEKNAIKIVPDNPSSFSGIALSPKEIWSKELEVGKTYTLSIYARYEGAKGSQPRMYLNSSINYMVSSGEIKEDSYERLYLTFEYAGSDPRIHFRFNGFETIYLSTRIQLEEGNKVTPWGPAVEDVNNAIEAARQLAIDADNARQQLANSLKSLAYEDVVEVAKLGDTVMQGGYFKTALIDVDNVFAQNVTATGHITAENLTVTGTSKVGDFTIENGYLSSTAANGGVMIRSANSPNRLYAGIGASAAQVALPATWGGELPAVFGNTRDTFDENISLFLEARNGGSNTAIYVQAGTARLKGLALGVRLLSGAGPFTLNDDDGFVSVSQTAQDAWIYLPSEPKPGRFLIIDNNNNQYRLKVSGNGRHIALPNNSSSEVHDLRAVTIMVIFIGTVWKLINWAS